MKTIIIWAVLIIIVLTGLYFVFKGSAASAPVDTTTDTTAASTTPQVQAQDITVGTGTEAQPGDTVSVLYTGKLPDGTVFDSSAAHDNVPLEFVLGTQGMIPGFQIGVNTMKEGGTRLLAIPPELAYGAQSITDPETGKVVIPSNSPLIFEVKLVKVVKAGAATTTPASASTAPTSAQ